MKKWQSGLLLLLGLVVAFCLYVFIQLRTIEVEQLSDDLFVLRGLGGNTAVLRTDAGAVVVDTMMLPMQGERIRELAGELTGKEPALLINTHYHIDHTHGNPAFEPGTRVLSTERTLSHLKALDAEFWQGDAARLLPTETFTDRMTLNVGGKTLELIHPGAGHTDGDLVVLFKDEGVLHTGDLMFNHYYPNIDLEAGGSVQQWVGTLENLLRLDFTRVIPGHGETSDRAGLRQFLAVIAQLAGIGRTAAEKGWTLERTLETDQLTADAGYRRVRMIFPLPMNREFVITRAWEETTGNFKRLD
ncbi:MAG: MBL fold metallo-hydrolase [Gammaproteobacteria bacterium]|nr:MBL fold metallo-hydrolase [Gammaproteobacteria bacterium]MDH5172241.1 MBL fold metallo-hydrolase [Gammaproteobacteria bacterium]